MKAEKGPLLSTLLGLLLLSIPGTRGANPALVARITDKGLEYGEKSKYRLAWEVGHRAHYGCGGHCPSGREPAMWVCGNSCDSGWSLSRCVT